MGRRRPIDRVNWRLYRRAWLLPAVAFLVVLATSFGPERAPDSPLPPSFTNEQADELIQRADRFSERFPDRRPGTATAIDAAQWVRDELRDAGLAATTVPATTTHPRTGASVGIANVEAVLPGRTRETVVVLARRDNLGSDAKGGGDPVGTLALIQLAEDLSATRDRRRTFLLASTDAGTLNGAGSRALAQRLLRRGRDVVAVIALDRPGSAGRTTWVPAAPAGDFVPPLGLAQAARDAVTAEGGDASQPRASAQLLRLALPVTLLGHGALVKAGIPAVTISGGGERPDSARLRPVTTEVGDAVRVVQRILGTLDTVNTLQSAGKTYVSSSQRVYRGWALKILIASLLLPVWLAAAELFVRHRRAWNIPATVGSVSRAAMAGLFGLMSLWLVCALGLFPGAADKPPLPGAVDTLPVVGLVVWGLLATTGWLLARGPDWRRAQAAGRDVADIVIAILAGCVLCAFMLASSPYTVLLFAPALHLWLVLASRLAYSSGATAAVWAGGLVVPAAGLVVLGAAAGTGLRSPVYGLELVASRSLPAGVTVPAAALAGLGLLALVSAFGRVGSPALPAVRGALAAIGAWVERPTHRPLNLGRLRAASPRNLPSPRLPSRARPRARMREPEAPLDNASQRAARRTAERSARKRLISR